MIARKISSSVGCFSTYSTVAGGSSCFSSASVPLAMIRPSCRIAIRSASCSASSRYCVSAAPSYPPAASSRDAVPHLESRLRVEPSGRLVQEDHRRITDQAHRNVEAPPHSSGVRRDAAVGGFGELEAGQQFLGDLRECP